MPDRSRIVKKKNIHRICINEQLKVFQQVEIDKKKKTKKYDSHHCNKNGNTLYVSASFIV